MAFSQLPLTSSMPNYFIYRESKPGEAFDPTANLAFLPPKGSDELFDALRMEFPHLKSHSERMRQAVIQFLMEERETEKSLQTSPAMTVESTWPAVSTGSVQSVLSSPDTNNLSTPVSFTASPQPQPQSVALTRQASTVTHVRQSSPAALDQMTSVFSLSTSQQPKQRVRRKMTEAEKVEYRKRRIVKACDKCAKRKRKCPHNQAQMETTTPPTSKSSSKAPKSSSPRSSKPPSEKQHMGLDPTVLSTEDDDLNLFDVSSFDFEPFMPTNDFALFQDDESLMDLNMDSFVPYDRFDPTASYQNGQLFTPELSPGQQGWQHSNILTEYERSFANRTQTDQTAWDSYYSSPAELYRSSASVGRQLSSHSEQTTPIEMFSSLDSLSSASDSQQQQSSQFGNASQLRGGYEGGNNSEWNSQRGGTATSKLGTSSEQQVEGQLGGFARFKKRRVDTLGGDGGDLLPRDHQMGQSEKPVPTHTSHVHEAQSRESRDLNGVTVSPQETSKRYPQQQRLSEAHARAADHQPGLSQPQRQQTQVSKPLDQAATLFENHQRGPRISTLRNERGSRLGMEVSSRMEQSASFSAVQDLTSTSVSVSGGLVSTALQGRPPSSSGKLAVTRQASPTEAHTKPRNSQQSQQSLGEGLPRDANASSQLYMARKRIMSGRSANSRVQTRTTHTGLPILQQRQILAVQPTQVAAAVDVRAGTYQVRVAGVAGIVGVAQDRLSDHTRHRDHHGPQDVHVDRLRDTRRYKDHHGRAPLSSYLSALFGCVLLLAVCHLFAVPVSSTALLLAFVSTQEATSQMSSFEQTVRGTTKNSSWPSSSAVTSFAQKKKSALAVRSLPHAKRGWSWPQGPWALPALSCYRC